MDHTVYFALFLTLLAGLSTGIGSLIALFAPRSKDTFLAVSLGFSAGVMLYVSFVEILPRSTADLSPLVWGDWIGVGMFFGGVLVTALIDAVIPVPRNPHHCMLVDETAGPQEELSEQMALGRAGLLTALAIMIHNFPEGLATFLTGLGDPTLGVAIAVAIAIHNVPEGISVSVPVYYATGDRSKAFWISFFSGLSEPLGALLGWGILYVFVPSLTQMVTGAMLGGVAGVMVFISLDQLLPNAWKYGRGHEAMAGLVGGMLVMALSLLLLSP